MTHTPGPWTVTGYHVEAPAGAVATVCDAGDDDTEGAANARLIAAAPELLAALQTAHMAVCNWIPTNAGSRLAKDKALAEIDAAIAAATVET